MNLVNGNIVKNTILASVASASIMSFLIGCSTTQLSAQRAFDSVADLASVTTTEIAAVSSSLQSKLAPQDLPYFKIMAAVIVVMIIHSIHLNIRVRRGSMDASV